MQQIIVRPLLTEKTLLLAGQGWYSFEVHGTSTKKSLASAIRNQFHVTVESVRTSWRHGKVRRTGRRQSLVPRADWKRATVKLAKGQRIDAFHITQETEKK